MVPIHRHPTKDECFVILRGKVRVTTHNDDGAVVLSQESGNYGVDIPKNVESIWDGITCYILQHLKRGVPVLTYEYDLDWYTLYRDRYGDSIWAEQLGYY